MSGMKHDKSVQLPEYETPAVISLTKVPRGKGQGQLCSPGQSATVDCTNGYSALSTCAPTGLAAGGTCSTGDGATLPPPTEEAI